jgi:hypothetical protein
MNVGLDVLGQVMRVCTGVDVHNKQVCVQHECGSGCVWATRFYELGSLLVPNNCPQQAEGLPNPC